MNIIRFLTENEDVRFGTDYRDGSAELLEGDISRGFDATGQRATVKRLLAPIAPANIYCIGLNYREHARETGSELPEYPIIFMKPTTAVIGHGDPIPLPKCCTRGPEVDFEGELAVVIGKTARDVKESEALEHVFGYTVANDISARKWQRNAGGKQWIRGKGFDGFCPLGPKLITADDIPDPQALAIRTWVNGEIMQENTTADMIFSVAEIISYLSEDTTLMPGTLILTGTPWGVGYVRKPPKYLSEGDQVTVEFEGIGTLTNPVREA
uniref:2-keto-4-pentenoate hydratase/2-oxohepta-3-ene-1,7-dioic acid hydratase (Catechol pathway) n=1 Tax=Candidatus Kentrum sp. MB TaxID=2138164 RepID=A0A451BCJ6_9GAMM|nr:MAG: 2-keto-4-pentenoate hydratase/2-oxohepta-3-ene-1,7-dioic acid hydratase (catechol pathway) [Candidatus Kentron sp. MB]VFK32620.1 MAG: 2-keto-4-pentenoate hydratase/2-oxohepta-3-ene-1,7-dioic acid hydratase (catechol pathway) [Candidatus Kentron sp. MB]VFK76001.1 MAG: 2-keto-4-pentenoate hydratase/2-oxohepta-3-ene-1,7-dioic acid hydratase (catechol pathway) [Candidatus Kentron sp. MB]